MERRNANVKNMETQCLSEKESEEHGEEDAKVAELGKELASSLELGSGGVDRWLTPEDLDHHDQTIMAVIMTTFMTTMNE